MFRYDGWRKVWVVSRPEGEADVAEEELLEFLDSELEKRGRREG